MIGDALTIMVQLRVPNLSVPRIQHAILVTACSIVMNRFAGIYLAPAQIGSHLPYPIAHPLMERGGIGGIGGAFGYGADKSMIQRIQDAVKTLIKEAPDSYERTRAWGGVYTAHGKIANCQYSEPIALYREKP